MFKNGMEAKIKPRDKKIIVLIGIMGSGKTTTGFSLAQRLNLKFVDSDSEIEKKENKSVNDVFVEKGEEYVKELEKDIVKKILNANEPQVLSIGGDVFENEEVRKLIKRETISVFLEVEFDTLLQRVRKRDTRYVLENGDKEEILREIFDKKTPIYREADIVVNVTYLNKEITTNVIFNSLSQFIMDN
ncbi:MAG: AAA family ATPase [Rickettsiales bacterium]|jgi:shikimate kinase|nr:AAA family ATPase [Rickettsiales bacterium]